MEAGRPASPLMQGVLLVLFPLALVAAVSLLPFGPERSSRVAPIVALLASAVSEAFGLARLQAVTKRGTRGHKVVAYLLGLVGMVLLLFFALGAFQMLFD